MTEAMEWVPFSSWVQIDVLSIPRGSKRFSRLGRARAGFGQAVQGPGRAVPRPGGGTGGPRVGRGRGAVRARCGPGR
ncbi:hypothetical protein GCM10010358_72150 [Streptomyces minutiscleroticus]|uniref:Uncharacterized protein n=1 Tax=Streptomyces minutiscleroticus TaxID=68238 RepID=A0A918NZT7_9ACTN|nr:hypothetical protein GCM10010358_72150 [Streptomyces minutiscleroticus]